MKFYRRFVTVALSLALLMVLAGCDTTQTTNNPAPAPNNPTPQPQPVTFPGFNLQANPPIVPFPNSIPGILVNPVTGQNTVPGMGEPFDSINSLFGYSTSGNLLIPFEGGVRPETVTNDSIQMFNTVTGDQVLLAFQVVNDASGSSLVIATPVLPLVEDTDYVVVITSNVIGAASGLPVLSSNLINVLKNATPIVDGNGNSQVFGLDDATAQQLEPIRQALQPSWLAAEAATGQSRTNIPFAYIYHTQPLYDTLQNLVGQAETDNPVASGPVFDPSFNPLNIPEAAGNMPVLGFPVNIAPGGSVNYMDFGPPPNALDGSPLEGARFVPQDFVNNGFMTPAAPSVQTVFMSFEIAALGGPAAIGTLLDAAGDTDQSEVSLRGIFVGSLPIPNYLPTLASDDINGFFSNPPVATEVLNVPFIAFTPEMPNGVMIYQHGITTQKATGFFLAENVADTNRVLIAIDLPDHGFFNPQIDVINNVTRAPGPDGLVDPDGAHYINLSSLRRSRDNNRQAVINLSYLADMIAHGGLNPAMQPFPGGITVGAVTPTTIGMSLGGIVEGIHAAVDPHVERAVLNVAGGRLTALLLNSQTFSGPIIAGLAGQGIQQGTVQFLQFFIIAQTVVDDGDPINYARHWLSGLLSGTPTQILMQEAIGDQVVPNSATEDLARSSAASGMPISQLAPVVNAIAFLPGPVALPTAVGVSGIFQFVTNANHGALLSGPPNIAAAMRTQAFIMQLTGSIPVVPQRSDAGGVELPLEINPGVFFGN